MPRVMLCITADIDEQANTLQIVKMEGPLKHNALCTTILRHALVRYREVYRNGGPGANAEYCRVSIVPDPGQPANREECEAVMNSLAAKAAAGEYAVLPQAQQPPGLSYVERGRIGGKEGTVLVRPGYPQAVSLRDSGILPPTAAVPEQPLLDQPTEEVRQAEPTPEPIATES